MGDFVPGVKLDPTQVEDRRNVKGPPVPSWMTRAQSLKGWRKWQARQLAKKAVFPKITPKK